MSNTTLPRQPRDKGPRDKERRKIGRKVLNRIVENDMIRRVSADEYREKVTNVYSGPKGALLSTCSLLSLHLPLGERLFRERKFDLRGARSILDIGSGAGQLAKNLIKYADTEASITCFDLSRQMLRRARTRLGASMPNASRHDATPRPSKTRRRGIRRTTMPAFVTADMAQMPFADASFDCITCGYVLEHLPDPRPGLAEIARVLAPGGRMLLLVTEDTFSGAWTSRMWTCRTYNRRELRGVCEQLGMSWKNELWFTRMHKAIRAGGICVELERQ
jgi:ubiquinone/menaquinone biosynthesis C-methylase UbiE